KTYTRPPKNLADALRRDDWDVWFSAMQREVHSLRVDHKAITAVRLPPGEKAIPVRWVYDYKHNPDGSIIRGKEKARLVAQGFRQLPGEFAHVIRRGAILYSLSRRIW